MWELPKSLKDGLFLKHAVGLIPKDILAGDPGLEEEGI